jgi:hypothetical protein
MLSKYINSNKFEMPVAQATLAAMNVGGDESNSAVAQYLWQLLAGLIRSEFTELVVSVPEDDGMDKKFKIFFDPRFQSLVLQRFVYSDNLLGYPEFKEIQYNYSGNTIEYFEEILQYVISFDSFDMVSFINIR